jgi:hypothetical protein
VWVEAEVATISDYGFITTPMDVKDSNQASGDRYLEVESGNNSISSVPTLGQVCKTFNVANDGTYRVWARVQAPTVDDDSFWFNMNGGAWVRWNQIAPGSSWHREHVHDNDTPTTPSTFTLTAGQNTYCIAYREDGARVDVFIITDNTSFSPTAALTGPPAPPVRVFAVQGDGRNVVSWTNVLGATSYTLESRTDLTWSTLVSGLTVHSYFHNLTPNTFICYRVRAVASTGTSAPSDEFCDARAVLDPQDHIISPVDFPATAPLENINNGDGLGAPEGNDSKDVVPVMGHARYDFRIAKTVTVGVWEIADAPDPGSDSWWVRMDKGAWIKWNEITPDHNNCDWAQVWDSDAGNTPVTFTLSPGSHRLEFAYREDGTTLLRNYIFPTAPGACFD